MKTTGAKKLTKNTNEQKKEQKIDFFPQYSQ